MIEVIKEMYDLNIVKTSDELKKRVCKIVGIDENLVDYFGLEVFISFNDVLAFLVDYRVKSDKYDYIVKLIVSELEKCLLNEKIKFEPRKEFNKIVENAKKLKEKHKVKFYMFLDYDGLMKIVGEKIISGKDEKIIEFSGVLGSVKIRNKKLYEEIIKNKLKVLETI